MEKNSNEINNSIFPWFMNGISFADKIVLFLTALLVLSPFGPLIVNFGGYYIIEIYFVFLIIYLGVVKPKIFKTISGVMKLTPFILFICLIFILMIVGWINTGDFFGAYSDFRATAVLGYSFCFFLYSNQYLKEKINVIAILSLLTVVLSIIYTAYFNYDSTKNSYNIFSIVILLYLSVLKKSPILYFSASFFMIYIAITSFYRSYWLIGGFSIILFYIILSDSYRNYFSKKKILQYLGLSSVIGLGYYFLTSGVILNYFTSTESRFIQSIGKWNDLVGIIQGTGNLGESETIRLNYYIFMKDNFIQLLMPHGIGYEALIENPELYFTNYFMYFNSLDSALLYMSVHYGILFSFLIIGIFIFYITNKILLLEKVTKINKAAVLSGLFIFILYSSISGDFFTVIQKAFFIGSFLGLIINSRITEKLYEV